ncbi:MAG: hydrogenase maturation nickel metallochaperone HypA [Actinomycetota bacterium]|nr:hydrogenase maturation nickel metallochaperone HypA [Actinomycetota bacterium]
MHELSIAEAVVQIVCRHAGDRRVASVELKVGHLRQVVPDALTFAFGLVAEGTVAEGAALEIEDVPAQGRCRDCGAESAPTGFPLLCAHCGSWDLEVLRGEELLVDSLELEEREMSHGH